MKWQWHQLDNMQIIFTLCTRQIPHQHLIAEFIFIGQMRNQQCQSTEGSFGFRAVDRDLCKVPVLCGHVGSSTAVAWSSKWTTSNCSQQQ